MRLEDVVVGISKLGEAEPVGAGFLIADRLVATCAHVVNAALERDSDAVTRPQASHKVALRFRTIDAKPLQAFVAEDDDAWSAPPARRKLGADFCLLRLEGELPRLVVPAEFGQNRYLTGRSFRAVGFPKDWEFDIAVGQIVGEDQGFFLLRPDPAISAALLTRPKPGILGKETRPAGIIYHGFSGGPVEVDGTVVGMLSEALQTIPDATAFMLPVSAFPKRFSKQAHCISPDEATAFRPAEPGSPNAVLVTNYLDGVTGEVTATKIFIKRKVGGQAVESVLPPLPADSKAPKAADEFIGSAAKRVGKLVLLGEPGLGKSTVLKHLEADTAAATLKDGNPSEAYLIPILIELKNYHGESELESLLAARVNEILKKTQTSLSADSVESTRIMKAWLNDQTFQFLILLDALDEVPAEHYQRVRSALKTLLNYPHRFVISCRTADYDQSLHELARPFVLVPLQSEEIGDYLQRVLGEKGEALFKEQLTSNGKMLSLASNALFLSMIVEIAKRDMKLPRNRGLLFKGFVDAMLKRRRRSGARLQISSDIVLTALAALGAGTLDRNASRPALSDLRRWQIPCGQESLEAVLAEARKYGFLLSDGSGVDPIEFIHPLWGQYFAAEYLNGLLGSPKPDFRRELGKRIAERQWREAIIMLAGLSSRPLDLVNLLASRVKKEAGSGRLFAADLSSWRWLGILHVLIFGTQVDLLMQCWESSSASGNAAARKAVVDVLRIVIRQAGPAISVDAASAAPECGAALRAVQRIRAVEALPELNQFLTFETKRENPGFFDWFLSIFTPQLFKQARGIADELRQKAK